MFITGSLLRFHPRGCQQRHEIEHLGGAMNRRPNPAVTDPCGSCLGWGATTVHKGTDYENDDECLDCRGSGRQATKHEVGGRQP